MATVLRNRFSYHRRLFLLLFAFSWALVACFVTFQYSREKRFKAAGVSEDDRPGEAALSPH